MRICLLQTWKIATVESEALSILIEILEEMQEQINATHKQIDAIQTVCVLRYNIAKKEKQLEKLSMILKEMEQMPDSDELARMENE